MTSSAATLLTINGLDENGRGVTRLDGKVCFLSNALPGETVTAFRILKNKKQYVIGEATAIRRASAVRTDPPCPHFGVCGGCSLQHIDVRAQVAMKQRTLEDALQHIGKLNPQTVLPAIYGSGSAYRFRARMSVKHVAKKGGVLVGFHEKASPFIADMRQCIIMPRHVSALIVPLREMIARLSIRDRLPQIEWAVGAHLTVMAFRIMDALSEDDQAIVRAFVDEYQSDEYPLQLWLQPGKADSLQPFYPEHMPQRLSYLLPEFDLEMPFHPTEFTQVNPYINQVMVSRAMALLQPQAGETIADMFCGLGNFSLPIARRGAQAIGVEGSEALVQRARENAAFNGLAEQCCFQAADLFRREEFDLQRWAACDKWLIDPPRDGAFELVSALENNQNPKLIVYVSCKPATLARDAEVLQSKGFVLRSAGVMNMFPHTAHVESIAVFERK
ncbi:MAG: 23S rRNA (uracil(1939)-C(5))-methyltransferase RlmD [Neisseria sp.]|nr:23S rRNA (uracil(1939)-C(5))-methyltransferase RlmD [Neisseria sp.]